MLTIVNDTHLGVVRSAGTTPATALTLRGWMLQKFEEILEETDNDLLILGDLFDTYQIPMTDLLRVYQLLDNWVRNNNYQTLHLVPGNHDLSTDSSKLSSFQFLGQLLLANAANRTFTEGNGVQYYAKGGYVVGHPNVYVIPHVANQDLFDMELARVPECDYLLVHCNYENNFAKESDHSLNFSRDQVRECKAQNILFAHEHARRRINDKVYILGNSIPSSISDCLDGSDKCTHTISAGSVQRSSTFIVEAPDGYREIDWRDPVESEARFIRFTGTCTSEESALAADTISRYRRQSDAFVIGNAVKVQTAEGQAQLEVDSLEAVRAFDIMGALKDYLTESEWGIIQGLK